MNLQQVRHETLDFDQCFAGEPAAGGIADDVARAEEAQQRRRHTVGTAIGGVAVLALSVGLISGLPGAGPVNQPTAQPNEPTVVAAGPNSLRAKDAEDCLFNSKIKECVVDGPARIRIQRESPGTEAQARAEKISAAKLRQQVNELNKRAAAGEKVDAEIWLGDGQGK